ncbi:glycoside hydrolase family 1 protein [Mesoplasma florum]|uniref:glycoside hydrolase family 1 protein n=1 Tax=Mesoplasma florum TaxID=2151 RepID=UPI000BE260F8|nr:glycoside hydrolase family 1 protein [Mesoplasma florum]ATI72965.1 6-phospho-beta-glucosidase [Mesoplasma florum]AVN61368.1 6-phospho-beta-glucosidase [Mesoplasma florum]
MGKFPKDFLWGASTSAYQIEGAINQGGKVPSIMDKFDEQASYPKGITGFKIASDHYNHWKEDVALMAEMGFKSYRFSISWPRIIKNVQGDINEEGIKFYDDLIDELLKNKIEPVVTIFHFDTPDFIQEVGGACTNEFTNLFEHYSEVLFKKFGKKVKYWLTINELNMFALAGQVIGVVPSDKKVNPWQLMHHLNVAQAKSIRKFREICPNGKIGPAPNISSVYSNTNKPEDYTAKLNMDIVRNWVYLDIVCRGEYSSFFMNGLKKMGLEIETTKEELEILKNSKPDFIAFNYYATMTAQMPEKQKAENVKKDQQSGLTIPGFGEAVKNDKLQKTQFGWEIDPVGFRNTLREVYDRYNLPIMITENGIGAKDVLEKNAEIHDDYRIDYYQKHIQQMGLAIEDGVEMIGYMPWSAIDLVSTHEGISKRYGFVYVNRDEFDLKDMKRIKKDSFYWYKDVIKTNGEKI